VNGVQTQYGGPDVWIYNPSDTFVRPTQPCAEFPPFVALKSDPIYSYFGGYGVEINGRFAGQTDSGQASVFFTDNMYTQAGREYGIQYVWRGPNQANPSLLLKWSTNTNCGGQCWTDSTYTQSIKEKDGWCEVDLSQLDVTQDHIYDIWFATNPLNGQPWVYCAVKEPVTFAAVTGVWKGRSGFSEVNGVFSGPLNYNDSLDASFPMPVLDQPSSAGPNSAPGWYVANIFPFQPFQSHGTETAQMILNWIKVAK